MFNSVVLPCQYIGILHDSLVAGGIGTNFKDRSPLCKLAAICLVLLTPFVKIIQPLGGTLSLTAKQVLHTLVNLDTGDHSLLFDQINERCSVICLLVESLMEEDDTTDGL